MVPAAVTSPYNTQELSSLQLCWLHLAQPVSWRRKFGLRMRYLSGHNSNSKSNNQKKTFGLASMNSISARWARVFYFVLTLPLAMVGFVLRLVTDMSLR